MERIKAALGSADRQPTPYHWHRILDYCAGFAVGAGVPQNCAQASITGRRSSKQSLGAKARKASGSTCPNAILMILEKPLWAAQVPKAYQKPWTVTSVRCIRFTSARMLPWERG
jgi:hypothetical protein